MELTDTDGPDTPEIWQPLLHAFSGERRSTLGIDPSTLLRGVDVLDPSWAITQGAIQKTNIYDMATTAPAVGGQDAAVAGIASGASKPRLVGFGSLPGCTTCFTRLTGTSITGSVAG